MAFLQPRSELIRVIHADTYADALHGNAASHSGREIGCDSAARRAADNKPCPTDSLEQWCAVLRADQPRLRSLLVECGGVLLRGLPVTSASDFEAVATQFLSKQDAYVGGVSRRSRVVNNVYNTTEAPRNVVIEQHLEATHTPKPPDTIVFNCQTPPARQGETPLASFVELFDALPRSVTDALQDEQVVYTRELMDRESRLYKVLPSKVTQSLALSWQEVAGSEDFQEAKQILESEGYEVSLRGPRRLRTRCWQPVVGVHPETGRSRWVLSDQITRQLPWHTRLPRRLLRSRLGMEFELESGRAFPQGALELVHQTLARIKFSFPWQKADVLVLDNRQMSHGRNTFEGDRLILTAFG